MQERMLEEAICRHFKEMLPDLAELGYVVRAQQAMIHKRRIDVLLRRPSDGHHCIIELKAENPPLPDTRDQILDYARCWVASFPEEKPPRLIVIGTKLSEPVRKDLASWNIESRAISMGEIQRILEINSDCNVPKGLVIDVPDTDRIRELLSDKSLLMVPEGMVLARPWDNHKVFLALAQRGEVHKELWLKDICVHLYGPRPGCAVLYLPTTRYFRAPLHLNPHRKCSWRQDIFERLIPYIEYSHSDRKKSQSCNYDHYRVLNWDGMAKAVGLEG